MIKFDIPSFLSLGAPKYSFDQGTSLPALRVFPPFLRKELYEIVSEDPISRKYANSFNRFVVITMIAIFFAGIALCLAVLTFRVFYSRRLFIPAILLLVICVVSSFMAWYNFNLMAERFTLYFNNKRDKGRGFTHYEINEDGIFPVDRNDIEREEKTIF